MSGASLWAASDDEMTANLGKDWAVSLGYKAWYADWETPIASYSPQAGASNISISKAQLQSIPSLGIKYKRLFLSGSFLFGPDFNYPVYQQVIRNVSASSPSTAFLTNTTVKASRQEQDVNLGYMFVPQLGITFGYKGVHQKYHITTSGTGLITSASDSKTNYDGGTAGMIGSVPIGGGFNLYGTAVGGYMNVSTDPSSTSNDYAIYNALESGLAYKAGTWPLSYSFGYKFQQLDTRTDSAAYKDLRAKDVTSGYTFGLNFVF